MEHYWSDKQVEYIRVNYGRMSAAMIANSLPVAPGEKCRTRNAVVGKAKRMGLCSDFVRGRNGEPPGVRPDDRPKARPRKYIARAPSSTGKPREVFKQVTLQEPDWVPLAGLICEPVSLLDRGEHQCSWPLDGGMYCGLDRLKTYNEPRTGKRVAPAYCSTHHHASIQPSKYKAGIWRGP